MADASPPALPPGPILLATDGEPHSEPALTWALHLGAATGRKVVAVHVKNPYLKQFYTEIYAQGRQEYLEHVEQCLEEAAVALIASFEAAAGERGVDHDHKVRRGEPFEELSREARDGGYALMVLGAKRQRGLERWQSENLPDRLAQVRDLPLFIVPS